MKTLLLTIYLLSFNFLHAQDIDQIMRQDTVYVKFKFSNTKPMVAFNWKDCLDNIALGGLQDCAFFQNEIGTFFPDGEIKTIVNTEKMNNYNQYKKLCASTLH